MYWLLEFQFGFLFGYQSAVLRHWLLQDTLRSPFESLPLSDTVSMASLPVLLVEPVPCLEDNFAYIIVDTRTLHAAVVDPVEPVKVLKALEELSQKYKLSGSPKLTHLLTTHKHWDHSGGNTDLVNLLKDRDVKIEVLGGKGDNVPSVTKEVSEGDTFTIGHLAVKVLHTPCHTRGHVLYVVSDQDDSGTCALFSGDTLFIAGCGRFF